MFYYFVSITILFFRIRQTSAQAQARAPEPSTRRALFSLSANTQGCLLAPWYHIRSVIKFGSLPILFAPVSGLSNEEQNTHLNETA